MDHNTQKNLNQKLLPEKLAVRMPALYSTDGKGLKAIAQVKFFTPFGGWYWYVTEFDGSDLFFGLIFGPYVEMGYFSLSELEVARDSLGLPVERDLSFRPKMLDQIKQEHKRREGQIRTYMI